jgi:hypothetical protein
MASKEDGLQMAPSSFYYKMIKKVDETNKFV